MNYHDGDFSTWTNDVYTGFGASGSQTTVVNTIGGNPGSFLDVLTQSGGNLGTAHWSPFTYNPGTSGALLSLSYSFDLKEFLSFGAGMGFGLLMSQGGIQYIPHYGNTAQNYSSWATYSNIDPSVSISTLNFADGGEIKFGLATWNIGGTGINVGFDNYSLSLTTGGVTTTPPTSSVPDSGSSAALIVIALAGMLGLRGFVRS